MGRNSTTGMPYVVRRKGAFRYVRDVPKDAREAIGRCVWIKTWKRSTAVTIVELEARKEAVKHDLILAHARANGGLTDEAIAEAEAGARAIMENGRIEVAEALALFESDGPIPPAQRALVTALQNDGHYRPAGMTLSQVRARDARLRDGERDAKPIKIAVDSFCRIVADKDVTAIRRDDVIAWLAAMEAEGLSPATRRRRLGALRALLGRHFLDTEYGGANPFGKHTIKRSAGSASDRLPFNRKMIAAIDSYLTRSRVTPETRNLMMMMKCTGCGPGEIGGLVVGDVRLDGKIPHIYVRPNVQRGVKASVRERRVPLVGDALNAAKDATARARKRNDADGTPLFTGFGMNERGADYLSATLNAAIRRAGVPKSKRLTVYSYRHAVTEALRAAGVPDHVQRRLMGHAGHGVHDRYGSRQSRLVEARDALLAAMKHLGDIDDSEYENHERMASPEAPTTSQTSTPKRRTGKGKKASSEEWYTPPELVAQILKALGRDRFDTDPCSPPAKHIPATTHYTKADDGLAQPWHGVVFCNPPYGRMTGQWTAKARNEIAAGHASLVVGLLPAWTDRKWFASDVRLGASLEISKLPDVLEVAPATLLQLPPKRGRRRAGRAPAGP